MKTFKFLLSGVLALFIMNACKKDNDNMNETDRNFLIQASYGNNAEIQAGQLAATKGNNAAVRAFGQMMVSDHTNAQNDLENIADDKDVNVPDQPDATHQALLQRLMTLQGLDFDTAYMNSQVMDHQMTVQLFQTELANGRDKRVKEYANRYLPGIQMHLQKADSLARALR